jgi:RNA recognition motif-containing protein
MFSLDIFSVKFLKCLVCFFIELQKDQACKSSGKIFVQNIPKCINIKFLDDMFSPFGDIHCCNLAVNENGESQGYGMLSFVKESDAANATRHMNGYVLNDERIM